MTNIQIMAVGSAKAADRRRPRIRLAGLWLAEIGFTADSLVTASYDRGSINLKLQGQGMETYSRLISQIRKDKSGLIQVRSLLHNKKRTPHLEVKGFWLERFGFTIGGVIAVRQEYGFIQIRLLDLSKLEFGYPEAPGQRGSPLYIE